MMKKIAYIFPVLLFSSPLVVSAQNIWKDAYCGGKTRIVDGGPTGPCGFCDAVIVTNNIIGYLTQLGILITVAMIAYGAITMMISAGDQGKFGEGKSKMTSAVIGLVIVLCAWVIVSTILHLLAGNNAAFWNQVQCK